MELCLLHLDELRLHRAHALVERDERHAALRAPPSPLARGNNGGERFELRQLLILRSRTVEFGTQAEARRGSLGDASHNLFDVQDFGASSDELGLEHRSDVVVL